MSKFVLTDENYYGREADMHYMSCSQYQSFCNCEAATIARMRGEWEPSNPSDALFQGQYFHAALESEEAFERFCRDGEEKIFKMKIRKDKATGIETVERTGKYAPFLKLDEMANVVREKAGSILEWPGQNELFMTGEIGGIPWRMKMDKYASGRRIIDYKTSANLHEDFYNPATKQRESFIEKYGYMMRAAVYGEIERQNAQADGFPVFIIIGVSKQDPPDFEVYMLNDDNRWMLELENLKPRLIRFQRIKEGHENPRRCGMCEYCRKTKQFTRILSYTDLMPEFRNDPDNWEFDDYDGQSVFDTL